MFFIIETSLRKWGNTLIIYFSDSSDKMENLFKDSFDPKTRSCIFKEATVLAMVAVMSMSCIFFLGCGIYK
jgi:hypothetical protein